MGKRSNFKRRPQDAYDTPPEAVAPLIPHLPEGGDYWEPCAGNGSLIKAMPNWFPYRAATDIEPRAEWVQRRDAFDVGPHLLASHIITNPPWTRDILHPMIEHFCAMRPTWLLFDADWMHTKQSAPYLKWCRKIVSVGRVKWIPDSPYTGKDNCAWYLFDMHSGTRTEFCGREAA